MLHLSVLLDSSMASSFLLLISILTINYCAIFSFALKVHVGAGTGLSLSKVCSKKCESSFCKVPPLLRYGKYCGILYSGCPGEKPCDELDACCMKHDACISANNRVSPLVGLRSGGFTVGQTALKAASCKVTKHGKTCIENQHVFISSAFDTFGFLAQEAVELLNRVQRVMHDNVMTPRSLNVVFKRISFPIQKGVAAQLVARLPSTLI